MKIGIITWVKYNNFGSLLQAYALQKSINDLGQTCEILDDSKIDNHKSEYIKVTIKKIISTLYHFVFNYKAYIIKRKSEVLANRFRLKFLNIKSDIQPLSRLNHYYDILVCGSDQIWHPTTAIFNPFYYAGFYSGKKIAYAPSLGTVEYPSEFFHKNVKVLIEGFSHLSIRERQGAEILASLSNREVSTVVDPTLLLSSKEWDRIIPKNENQNKPYVLCYFLTNNRWYVEYAIKYAEKNRLELKMFQTFNDKSLDKYLVAAGPLEFLSLIKNCQVMFTDSFHGTIFSIHLKKRFFTFQRFCGKNVNNQNIRILNLFSTLGIDDKYFISENQCPEVESLPPLDFNKIELKLKEVSEESLNYLKTAIFN